MSHTPPLIVLEDRASLADLRVILTRCGWTLRDGFPSLDTQWPLGESALVCVGTVEGAEDRQRAIRAGARGAGLVILGRSDDPTFEEDLARLGPITYYLTGDLTPRMLELLRAQARGRTVKQAAVDMHISEAVAWKAIRAARDVLGVRTNTEAVADAIRRHGAGCDLPANDPRR